MMEYFAPVTLSAAHIAQITASLQQDARYELLPARKPMQILLRIVRYPKRDKWPEDITIDAEATQIALAFSSAQGRDQDAFIALMESLLAKMGCPASFSEE